MPSDGSFNWSDLQARVNQRREQEGSDPLAQIVKRIHSADELLIQTR